MRGALLPTFFLWSTIFVGLAPLHGREYPPEAPPPKPLALPTPAVRALPNGLKVIVIERHSLPVVTLRLEVRAGAEADPPDHLGAAQMVAGLLNEGTATRSARQIAGTIDQVGGNIQTGAEWDESFADLSVLTDHTELGFNLLSDIVIRPAFAAAEVERERKQTLSALEVAHDDPAYVADTVFRRLVFSGTAYSHPEDGSRGAVERLTPRDLREFHSRFYRPGNSILAVVGDITPAEAWAQAEKYFGGWESRGRQERGQAGEGNSIRGVPAYASRQVVVIDKPDAVQTEIRIGSLGIARDSSDYYALSVANQILGGPASNRLFRELRSREGLTYGASSDLICYRTLGGWVAKTSTRTPQTVKGVKVALDQIKRLRNHAISGEELATAKDYLIGHQALEFETSEDIANQFLDLMLHDLPLDYWSGFLGHIQALRSDDVLAVTRRYFESDSTVVVLVGNAAGFKKDLRELGPSRVIPLSNVDFASDNLERSSAPVGRK